MTSLAFLAMSYNKLKKQKQQNKEELQEMIIKEGYDMYPFIFKLEYQEFLRFLSYRRIPSSELKRCIYCFVQSVFDFLDIESFYLFDYMNDYIFEFIIGYDVYSLGFEFYYNEMLDSISLFLSKNDIKFLVAFDVLKEELSRPLDMIIDLENRNQIEFRNGVRNICKSV